MKLTINKLYGYKIYRKKEANYTNSYHHALFKKQLLERTTNKKWKVIPTPEKECHEVWKDCPL